MPATPRKNPISFIGFNVTGDLGGMTAWRNMGGRIVWIDKSPPLNPPSTLQTQFRNMYRQYAAAWRALPAARRAAWLRAAKDAHLYVTGYNLWTYYQRTLDEPAIRTIERQTGETLLNA